MRRTKRGGWPYSQPPNIEFEINRASPQADGLVAWWPTLASRGARILRDFSGHGNDGSFPGGASDPTWILDAKYGWVLFFDADYINVGQNPILDITAQISISAWFNPSALAAHKMIVARYDGVSSANDSFFLRMDNGNAELFLRSSDGTAWTSAQKAGLTANTWQHVLGTFDGANITVYINGVAGAPVVNADTIRSNPTEDIYIAAMNTGGSGITGLLRDIRIYNVGKTGAEAYQMYANLWELYKPLIRRWPGWRSPVPPPVGGHMTLWGRYWGP